MYIILWEFIVHADYVSEFEKTYGPAGKWSELFQQTNGYQQTQLWKDNQQTNRYVVMDVWDSQDSYENLLRDWEKEYEALDVYCEQFTIKETSLGRFISINHQAIAARQV
jgi:heme-degrading monooxygenase HmoA